MAPWESLPACLSKRDRCGRKRQLDRQNVYVGMVKEGVNVYFFLEEYEAPYV